MKMVLSARVLKKEYASMSDAQEIDLTSTAFDALSAATLYPYDCSYWPDSRGLTTQGCPFSSALPALLLSGRAAVDSWVQIDVATFNRLGTLVTDGRIGGVIPFTSIGSSPDLLNTLNSFDLMGRAPSSFSTSTSVFNISQVLQGSTAQVSCTWDTSSQLKATRRDSSIPQTSLVSTSLLCDPQRANTAQVVGDLSAFAGLCAEGNSTWTLYVVLNGDVGLKTIREGGISTLILNGLHSMRNSRAGLKSFSRFVPKSSRLGWEGLE